MGKIKKRHRVSAIVAAVLLLTAAPVPAGAEVAADLQVEQVTAEMPDMKAYITGKDASKLDTEKIEAWKEEEQLKIAGLQDFRASGEKIHYFLLLDISSSISTADFKALKRAILDFGKNLDKKDEVTLLTFGDDVNQLWSRDEGTKALKERLKALVNDNMNTQLYEALIQVSEVCLSRDGMERNAAVVFTDGLDDIRGKSTKEEAVSRLAESGLPVYGIAIGSDDSENAKRFGELVRSSGGRLFLTQEEEALNTLNEMDAFLRDAAVLSLKADSNLVENKTQNIRFSFSQYGTVKNAEAGIFHWKPDNIAPQIKSVEQPEKNQLLVTFSEPVQGTGRAADFELKNAEERLFVPEGASFLDEKSVKLTFPEEFYQGDYSLSCRNIRDISMEANAVSDIYFMTLEGQKESKVRDFLKNWGWAGAVILLIFAVVTVLLLYLRIKKNKGVVVVDKRLTLASNLQEDMRQVINIRQKEGVHLVLTVSSGKSGTVRLERNLADSLIVGRSDMCEICIRDLKLSKQHFVLEYQSGNVFISDLESTNGTMLNGVRLTGRQKLDRNDKISAGNTSICVNW